MAHTLRDVLAVGVALTDATRRRLDAPPGDRRDALTGIIDRLLDERLTLAPH